jgi:hypothetical protein
VFVHHFGEATLGQLAADGGYGARFDANRRRFEEKWGEPWIGHDRRPDQDYQALVRRVQVAIGQHTEPGSVVLVVSKGDEDLLDLPGRAGWHFPRLTDGSYAGQHPAGDADAIGHLDELRRLGAAYFVVPATSSWWLTHYRGLAERLCAHHQEVSSNPDTAVIFSLARTIGQ